jgi:hypothetical protein
MIFYGLVFISLNHRMQLTTAGLGPEQLIRHQTYAIRRVSIKISIAVRALF